MMIIVGVNLSVWRNTSNAFLTFNYGEFAIIKTKRRVQIPSRAKSAD